MSLEKNKIKIYVFGNPLLNFDNLPIQLIPYLSKKFPNIEFIHIDPNENLRPINKKLIIIDTIINTKEIIVINDLDKIDKIESNPNYSMHDFDLGFNLKLLKKIGDLKEILLFGIPPKINRDTALKKLSTLINKNIKF